MIPVLCCPVLSQYNIHFFHNELMLAFAPTGAGRHFKSISPGPLAIRLYTIGKNLTKSFLYFGGSTVGLSRKHIII